MASEELDRLLAIARAAKVNVDEPYLTDAQWEFTSEFTYDVVIALLEELRAARGEIACALGHLWSADELYCRRCGRDAR